MTLFQNFLVQNGIESIENLENVIQNEPYNLKLKHFKNNELMIIVHDDKTNMDNELCLNSHGIIIDPDLNVLRFTGKKAIEDQTLSSEIHIENAIITPSIDGTFISVYKYGGKMYYSTKKSIEARLSKWISEKNFEELFIDSCKNTVNETNIQENYMYNFMICSNDAFNIVNYEKNHVVLLSVTEFGTCEKMQRPFFEGILNENVRYIEDMSIGRDEYTAFLERENGEKLNYQGIFIYDGENSQKIFLENYLKLKSIIPNNYDFYYIYLTLRKNNYFLEKFLTNNPQYRDTFQKWELEIINFVQYIHETYLSKHVQKTNKYIPKFLRVTIYKVHGIYLSTKNPITRNVIFKHLGILHEKQLYVLMKNFEKFKNHELEDQEQIEDDIIQTSMQEQGDIEDISSEIAATSMDEE